MGLLDEIEALGLGDDTIVVFSSDHGYHLGEHNMWAKQALFENVSRVPFLVSVPWLKQSHGKPCRRITELIDLFPTLTDLCGVATPAGLDGSSLAPLLKDPEQNPGEHRNLAAVPEHAELVERMTRQLRAKRIASGAPPDGPVKHFLFEGPRSKK